MFDRSVAWLAFSPEEVSPGVFALRLRASSSCAFVALPRARRPSPSIKERILVILSDCTTLRTFSKKIAPFALVALGSLILSFGIFNIHARSSVTEGGILGLTLLLQHWFGLSPAFTSPLLDGVCFLIGFRFLGKQFAKYSIAASLFYALFYRVWEVTGPLLPDISANPLAAAIAGALFVGVGVGFCVRVGGAAGGDDALAMAMTKALRLPISACYLFTDLSVLALSLTYIPLRQIAYSLVTVTVSSFLIQLIQNAGKRSADVPFVKARAKESITCSLTEAPQRKSF